MLLTCSKINEGVLDWVMVWASITVNINSTYLRVSHNVQQFYNIGSTRQILKNFDFSLDLFFFYRLQYLDNNSSLSGCMSTLKHFRVFSSANFFTYFIIVLIAIIHKVIMLVVVVVGGVLKEIFTPNWLVACHSRNILETYLNLHWRRLALWSDLY